MTYNPCGFATPLNRRTFLTVTGLGLSAASLSCTHGLRKTASTNPNIVIILADDMGFGDLACQNPDSKIPTPHLDRLAREGMRFTDAHSPSAVCSPTRYSLLTGRYCWRSDLKSSVLWPWDRPLIEPDRLTLGAMLKQHGYSTACIGKWHLGWEWATKDGSRINDELTIGVYNAKQREAFNSKIDFTQPIGGGPITRGFDYYFGDDVPNFPPYCFIENDRLLGFPSEEKPNTVHGNPGPMLNGWKMEDVMPALAEKAVAFIKAQPNEKPFSKAKDQPFLLYLPLTAPHTPIAPTEQFLGKSNAGLYGDYVYEVDWVVGQVMKALQESGQAENTIVLFTSDNGSPGRDGTNMAGPVNSVNRYGHYPSHIYRGIKADVWDGGHRVPFIAHWPGRIAAGSVNPETICLVDIMATFAALTGETLPDNAGEDSYNLLPAFLSEPYKTPIREATVHHSINGMFAIRQGEWKLILGKGSGGWTATTDNTGPELQLYNMKQDPSETKNLAETHPEIVERLNQLLEKYKAEGRSAPKH